MATIQKQTKEQTEPKKDTRESIADILNTYAVILTKAINRPNCKPDDPVIFYYNIVQLLKLCRKNAKKYLGIGLRDLPTLTGADYTRGMIDLIEWIESAKETINSGGGDKRKPKGKTEKKLPADVALLGVLAVEMKKNPDKKPTIAFLAKRAGFSRKTATAAKEKGAVIFRATYDKLYPKLPKKGKRVKWDDNRSDLSTRDPEPKD